MPARVQQIERVTQRSPLSYYQRAKAFCCIRLVCCKYCELARMLPFTRDREPTEQRALRFCQFAQPLATPRACSGIVVPVFEQQCMAAAPGVGRTEESLMPCSNSRRPSITARQQRPLSVRVLISLRY